MRIEDPIANQAEGRRDPASREEERGAAGVREEDGDGEADVAEGFAGAGGDGGVSQRHDPAAEGGGGGGRRLLLLRRRGGNGGGKEEREGGGGDGVQVLQR